MVRRFPTAVCVTVAALTSTACAGSALAATSSTLATVSYPSPLPFAMAIDSVGNIYTTAYNGSGVGKIAPGGSVSGLTTTGSKGRGIVVDAADNLYVTNWASNTVSKITSGGTTSILGATNNNPQGITIDAAGNLYVANLSSGNVTKFVPNGTPDIFPAPPATAASPNAVASDGSVTVTVTQNPVSSRFGAPSAYLVRAVSDAGKNCTVAFPGPGTCTISGLANGTAYTFETVAQLQTWDAAPSAPSTSVTPIGAPPTITAAISPDNGPTAGGTSITITGTGFQAGATVTVGGNACTGVNVASASSISCTTAAHAAGASDVVVTNTDTQSVTANGAFTFVAPPSPPTPVDTPPATAMPSEAAAASSTPATTAPMPPALRRLHATPPSQDGDTVVTRGVVPDGATRVVQIASGGTSQMSQMAFGTRAMVRIATSCPIAGSGSARTYTCRAHLGSGAWTLTTQAKAGSAVIAQSVNHVRVKATKRTAVTG